MTEFIRGPGKGPVDLNKVTKSRFVRGPGNRVLEKIHRLVSDESEEEKAVVQKPTVPENTQSISDLRQKLRQTPFVTSPVQKLTMPENIQPISDLRQKLRQTPFVTLLRTTLQSVPSARMPLPSTRTLPQAGWHRQALREDVESFGMPAFPVGTLFDWASVNDSLVLVIFVRGLPGVGKTTFAQTCFAERAIFEADLFAERRPGIPRAFPERHALCRDALIRHFKESMSGAIICNTFTQHWELKSYMSHLDVFVPSRLCVPLVFHLHHGTLTDAELAARTQHGVPQIRITEMRRRWEAWPGEIIIAHGGAATP